MINSSYFDTDGYRNYRYRKYQTNSEKEYMFTFNDNLNNCIGLYRIYFAIRLEFKWIYPIDNLFNKQYIGSVIVNEGNNRFFEPADGRNWSAGIKLSKQF